MVIWFMDGLQMIRPISVFGRRLGICQIVYTTKIAKFLNFTLEKQVDLDIFGPEMKNEDVLLIYFEQIVSFCAIIYPNTNSLKLFSENSSLNLANFRVVFHVNS